MSALLDSLLPKEDVEPVVDYPAVVLSADEMADVDDMGSVCDVLESPPPHAVRVAMSVRARRLRMVLSFVRGRCSA